MKRLGVQVTPSFGSETFTEQVLWAEDCSVRWEHRPLPQGLGSDLGTDGQ